MCGHSYDPSGRPADRLPLDPVPTPPSTEVRFTAGTAVRFGIGFAVGAAIVGVIIVLAWLIVLGLLLGTLRLAWQ